MTTFGHIFSKIRLKLARCCRDRAEPRFWEHLSSEFGACSRQFLVSQGSLGMTSVATGLFWATGMTTQGVTSGRSLSGGRVAGSRSLSGGERHNVRSAGLSKYGCEMSARGSDLGEKRCHRRRVLRTADFEGSEPVGEPCLETGLVVALCWYCVGTVVALVLHMRGTGTVVGAMLYCTSTALVLPWCAYGYCIGAAHLLEATRSKTASGRSSPKRGR